MGNKDTKEEVLSHSQEKREQRRKEVAKARRKAKTWTVIGYVIAAVVVGLIAWGVTATVMKQMDKVKASDDFSAGLDANGYISGLTVADKVTLPEDYLNLQVPYSEIEYTDEQIQSDIDEKLSANKEQSTDPTIKVADGDKVNISYVGTIDGVTFDGGTSDSYDLTIGSGSLIDTFEEQLIGSSVGDELTVNVTFPENYTTADLAGKPAEFAVTINSIYVTPEFSDEFVAANLSAYATTMDEYRTYLRETNEKENLENYVKTYLTDNSTVSSYPKKYVRILKGIQKYNDLQSYQYMNQIYAQYYGASVYNSFEDYVGMSETEYDESLKEKCQDTCKDIMIYQAIVEKSGETVDAAYVKKCMADDGQDESFYDTSVETSGEPAVLQGYIKTKGLEIVMAGVNVVK